MMASTSTSLRISITLQSVSFSRNPLSPTRILPNSFSLRQPPSRFPGLSCFSRRRGSANSSPTPKKIIKKKVAKKEVGEDEDIDEDAFEALFRQLEADLKNDELFGNDGEDDDISPEDLAKLEQELAEALEDDDELLVALGSALGNASNEEEGEEEGGDEKEDNDVANDEDGDEVDDDNEEEEETVKLKNWQLRRLAYALKEGRRKTSIKKLAAELCLERPIVLKLLRDPPPNLVMMSATLPDKPATKILDPVEKLEEAVSLETTSSAAGPKVEVKAPIHEMQSNWSARKRLKRVQVETLERVYGRSKRPTNAMISSIVHVTNLPRKRVVKWFEDKRAEDGVPEQHQQHRYERSVTESVFTS